jgi:hypothetical protein
MRSTLVCMIFCMSVFMVPFQSAAQVRPKPELLAQHSQVPWLQLIDSGKYADSWQEAAQTFHAHIAKDKWVAAMKLNRAPLGKMISRTLTSARFTKSLAGAPDGQYVVIVYETRYEHKQAAVETVTSVQELDGDWRVAGYFIK